MNGLASDLPWVIIVGMGLFFMILVYAFMIMFVISFSVLFVFKALLLSLMTKQQGMNNSFIAWIPIVNLYLLFKLSGVMLLPSLILFILVIIFPSIMLWPFVAYVLYAMIKLLKKCWIENSLLIPSILLIWIFPFLFIKCFYVAYKNVKDNYNNYNNYNNY